MSRDRTVEVRKDGPGRESWSISLSTSRYTDTLRLTPVEARMVHLVLGAAIANHESTEPPCADHKPVQHRDGKPPWCKACGLTADFNEPISRLPHKPTDL